MPLLHSGGEISVPHLAERLLAEAGRAEPRPGSDGGGQVEELLRGQDDGQDGPHRGAARRRQVDARILDTTDNRWVDGGIGVGD